MKILYIHLYLCPSDFLLLPFLPAALSILHLSATNVHTSGWNLPNALACKGLTLPGTGSLSKLV